MKQGLSINELASQLSEIQRTKRDFVAPVSQIVMTADGKIHLESLEQEPDASFSLNNWAAHQLAQWGGIPFAYYEKLREQNPTILAGNVNHALTYAASRATGPVAVLNRIPAQTERRLVRTIGGTARAFLSSRYRILDSSDMAETILPVAIENGLQVVSCDITEHRLYLKLSSPRLTAEIKRGDPVQYGVVVSTSDVGAGAARVEPFVLRLVCTNGMIAPDSSIRKFHIGRDMEAEFVREIFSDETRRKDDAIFWDKVRDVFLHSLQHEVFHGLVDRLRVAANEPIRNPDLPRVVELTSRALGIAGDDNRTSILNHLSRGGDLSRWGLVNAITATANDAGTYEGATDLERAGGLVLDLSENDWKRIAN